MIDKLTYYSFYISITVAFFMGCFVNYWMSILWLLAIIALGIASILYKMNDFSENKEKK